MKIDSWYAVFKTGAVTNVTSVMDKSIDNNDNDKNIFSLVNPRDHKIKGRLKCFQTSCKQFFLIVGIEIQGFYGD